MKMGEMKPIGSEKLIGDAKLQRILELTYYNSSNDSKKSYEIIRESSAGVYGIVKEKDGYYVKRGLNESSLDYIGGLFMKNKNRFRSYGEALKRMELLAGSDQLNEATKYILKQNKPTPQAEAPAPMPTDDAIGTSPVPSEEPNFSDMGAAPGEETPSIGDTKQEDADPWKTIQKLTGKLGQKLREYDEKIKSDDIKYVINMTLSAVDLQKLEDSDKEEILSKIEGNEESGDETTPEFNPDEIASEETPSESNDLEETETLENLINTPFENNEDVDFMDDEEINNEKPYPIHDALNKDPFSSEVNPDEMYDTDDEAPSIDFDNEYAKEKKLSTGNGGLSLNEEDPAYEEQDLTSAEEQVKELDIDELTNVVNQNVKETLSKYFN